MVDSKTVGSLGVAGANELLKLALKGTPVDMALLGEGLEISGNAMVEIGTRLKDGNLSERDVNELLAKVPTEGLIPSIFGSAIRRATEYVFG